MNTDPLYHALTNISICLTATLSIVLLFFRTPKMKSLEAYRQTKLSIIVAYILVTISNLLETTFSGVFEHHNMMIMNTLIIVSIQIFLFSSTIIILLESNSYTTSKIIRELVPSIFFAVFGFLVFGFGQTKVLPYYFLAFSAYFIFQVVYYTIFYLQIKKKVEHKLDNFFSEETFTGLKWTGITFIWLFFGGIFSVLSLFLNMHFVVFFTIFYNFFYLFFTIHYLNYVSLFIDLEPALGVTDKSVVPPGKNGNRTYEQLETAIKQWEDQKMFAEPGITIEQVALQLSSNRTYLSNHMNMHRKTSFKEWINQLRIKEAEALLLKHPELPVSQIGAMVGLPDKSNFGRQFAKVVGRSPKAWRKNPGH
jgi:AraC-like DNA-binding protein